MANDRIFIVCDVCKEYDFLTKWYPGCPINFDKKTLDAMNEFFEDHEDCIKHSMVLESVGFSFDSEDVYGREEYKRKAPKK
jgi:hypothetical protein